MSRGVKALISWLLVESVPLVRYTGSAHFSHPVSCLEIELCEGWQCRGVQKFPLSSVGEHIPPWEVKADQEDVDRLERKLADNYIICCAEKIQP